MDVDLLARVLRRRRVLARHDAWTTPRLRGYQARAVAGLRAHTMKHSALYRDLHAGLDDAPLTGLPPLTKGALVARYDDALTTGSLTLG